MSAIMGSLLVILGAFGFSVSLCLEYRMRLMLLKQIRGIYEYMEFQISYGKLPIPEILRKLSFKTSFVSGRSLDGLHSGWRKADRSLR